MERLHGAGHPSHLLSVQYRMPEPVCRWPSQRFYAGRLATAEDPKKHCLPDPCPALSSGEGGPSLMSNR